MAAKKFLRNSSGQIVEVLGVVVSAGAANDGDIPALDSTGKLDLTVMPVGIGPDAEEIYATEALSAGDLVNIWYNVGETRVECRKADCSNGRRAHGFVLDAVDADATALVYKDATNTSKSGLTAGTIYYLSTGGAVTDTAPSTNGYISQEVGYATTTTALAFEPQQPITIVTA